MITIEMIDRTIFELLRLKLVQKGYLPDIDVYSTPTDYKAAKDAMRAAKDPIIDICGVGYAEDRNAKTINKIVIDRTSSNRGMLGAWGLEFYEQYKNEDGDSRFRKYGLPDLQRTFNYQIRIVCNSSKMERIMDSIVTSTLGMMRQHKGVDNDRNVTDKVFNISFLGDADVSIEESYERVYSYQVPDVFVGEEEIIKENIVPLQTIGFCVSLVRRMEDIDLSKGGCQGDENSSCITIGEVVCDRVYGNTYGSAYGTCISEECDTVYGQQYNNVYGNCIEEYENMYGEQYEPVYN